MLSMFSALALAASLTVLPPQEAPGSAPEPGTEAVVPTAAAADLPAATAPQESPVTGLPQRAPEPRTMQAYWPVFALLAVTWLAFSAFLLRFAKRSARVAALAAGEGDR